MKLQHKKTEGRNITNRSVWATQQDPDQKENRQGVAAVRISECYKALLDFSGKVTNMLTPFLCSWATRTRAK